jgi:predicted GIY-YIG superfamily endonuclease
MAVVYLIEREDSLKYIGVTVNYTKRINTHSRGLRFSKSKIKKHKILFEGSYEECEEKEEYFIKKYNTYENGLNCTTTGKGLNGEAKFNTLGYIFSEESREKMRLSWTDERRKNLSEKNSVFFKEYWTDERRKEKSEKTKGRVFGPIKITESIKKEIRDLFQTKPDIPLSYQIKFVKKSHREKIISNEMQISDSTTLNGRRWSYGLVFCSYFANQYNCTPKHMSNIINGLDNAQPKEYDAIIKIGDIKEIYHNRKIPYESYINKIILIQRECHLDGTLLLDECTNHAGRKMSFDYEFCKYIGEKYKTPFNIVKKMLKEIR